MRACFSLRLRRDETALPFYRQTDQKYHEMANSFGKRLQN